MLNAGPCESFFALTPKRQQALSITQPCFLTHPYIDSRKNMDSSSEEDEEEFFETLEDLGSSSDTESAEGEGHNRNLSDNYMASASNALSRYEMWKNSPGSIVERRQRLLTRMGVNLDGVISENSMILVDVEPTVTSSFPPSSNCNNVEDANQGCRSVNHRDQRIAIRERIQAPSASGGWTMLRSRSDGTFSSRIENSVNMESPCLRLVRSGYASPVLHGSHQKRWNDTSSAMLQTVPGFDRLSRRHLGGKTGTGNSTPTLEEGLAARRLQFQWSKFGRFRVTDKNGNSLFDSSCSPGNATVKASSGVQETSRVPLQRICGSGKPAGGEVLCRIKDLDSGKEFVVNEVGKDGTWNKLKELETGREISLEEFESNLGLSPIVQEVMRREKEASDPNVANIQVDAGEGAQKKKKSWFNALKGLVRGSREKGNSFHHGRVSDDREGSTEKSGRSSVIDDSRDNLMRSRPVKVRTHKKSAKEFADLRLRQEIQAHEGAIWTMKFSLDGSYLATAGQDRLVRVWEVCLHNNRPNESPYSTGPGRLNEDGLLLRSGAVKRNRKSMSGRKTITSQIPVLFTLFENAKCVFKGHSEDVLDLSWSPSQSLLSSSMDKTVRLWNVSSKVCLRIFEHNDYVTCVQFHPFDAGHFISGSLDGKVRIWNIQEPQVVDWVDLQEMVTAASYTPNGQGAVVGSYKGTCRFYKTSGNKLQLDTTFEVRNNRAKRSHGKKITGFQFVPGDKKKLLITSSDSRIRIYDGTEISSKFKGFRNTKSHISASVNTNGTFIICASEDSRVCIWNYHNSKYDNSQQQRWSSGSYEDFSSKHVLVAIPWPGIGTQPAAVKPLDTRASNISWSLQREGNIPKAGGVTSGGIGARRSLSTSKYFEAKSVVAGDESSTHEWAGSDGTSSSVALESGSPAMSDVSRGMSTLSDLHDAELSEDASSPCSSTRLGSYRESSCGSFIHSNCVLGGNHHGFVVDSKGSATWPEEKLASLQRNSVRRRAGNHSANANSASGKDAATEEHALSTTLALSAWGLVIVTAGLGGEIQIFQNFSLPIRL